MPRIADPMAKSKLLLAARAEFATQGMEAARVEDIAKRAGLGKGSFYLHFDNKHEAFLQIVDAFFAETARLSDGCRGNFEHIRNAKQAADFFREHDRQLLEFLLANRDVLRMILDGTSPTYSHILDGFLDAKSQQASGDIGEFQKRGLYRSDVDPLIVARIFTGAFYNIARHLTQLKTKPEIKSLVDTIVKIFLEGVLSRPVKASR